ncbi:MAG: Fe2+-dependent dioxygenase [bacterium]
MLIEIPNILNAEELHGIQQLLANARFEDGKLSAGKAAKQVKHNQEVAGDSTELSRLNNLVMGKLIRHPVYQNAAFAKNIAAPFYARYTKGMKYGDHIDDPIMGSGQQVYRPDVSITVFLNAPEDYTGGELCIHTPFGQQLVKLPAGHAIMYPSGSLHRVQEVTAGTRLVAVTWAQSMIRDPAERELLYSLNQARELLLKRQPGEEVTKTVDHVYINLVRKWADV